MNLTPDYLRLCKESLSNQWGGKIHVVFHQLKDRLIKEDYKEAVRIIMTALEDLEKRQFTIDHARSEKTVYQQVLEALTLSPRIAAYYDYDDMVNELSLWFDHLSSAYYADETNRRQYFSIPVYRTIIMMTRQDPATAGTESSSGVVKYPRDEEDDTCIRKAWHRYHKIRVRNRNEMGARNSDNYYDTVFFCAAGNPDAVFPPNEYTPQFHQ